MVTSATKNLLILKVTASRGRLQLLLHVVKLLPHAHERYTHRRRERGSYPRDCIVPYSKR
jgi:hypothetical protein